MTLPQPPLTNRGDERAVLTGSLDFQRELMLWKIDGLDDEQLRRRMTPTGMSLLGVVKHLAYVEAGWFRDVFAGDPVPPEEAWREDDPTMDWRIEEHESTEAILELYRKRTGESRAIVSAAASLDALAHGENRRGPVSLRWIVVHMIEEYARHLGHADVMREAIDGGVGDRPGGTPVVPL